MTRIKTDICVIGAGSGGLSVASGAAQMGAKVVLIEAHKMGGDCLNYGCVPSKALIAAGKAAHHLRHAGEYGVSSVDPKVDYAAAKDHVHGAIETIAPHDSQERFEGMGVTVLRERAKFLSETEVQAGETVVEARRFVIATGSRPFVPPIEGLEDVTYYTNETIFDLREKPEHLLVIGGGPIGLEMAHAHLRLGCKVTVIEGDKALGKDDPDMAAIVLKRLRAEGLTIVEGAQAKAISGADGQITVETDDGTRHTGSHLLIAVGRKVNVDGLDLDKGNIAHDRAVKVDDRLRSTTNKRVYAVGDAAGGLQFTHVAGYHAGVVVRQAVLGLPAKAKTDHLPWTTYTDPELAHVGLTEAEARKRHGNDIDVVTADFDGNDRAVTEARTIGGIKVIVRKGRPIGATIVGEGAGDLIAPWALAIANNLKMTAFANTVLPYPTRSEISKRAASAYFSPKLFDNPWVKRVVRVVQRVLP